MKKGAGMTYHRIYLHKDICLCI